LCPCSVCQLAMRCPERPSSGRSRFDVRRCPTRVRGPFEQWRRPCGFTPCECDAGKLDVRTCRLRFRTAHGRAAYTRRLNESRLQSTRLRSRVREIVGATDRSFAHERPAISSVSASNIRRPTSVMHRGLLYPGVPLPIRAFTAWPGGGPSLLPPGNAPGVHQRPSQACSRIG
jgi:hypothetical protein